MKKTGIFWIILLLNACTSVTDGPGRGQRNTHYINNQEPLVAQPYAALNLGDIQPEGWLLRMLELQRDGLTGHLDSIYALVCGETNGWLGGHGDCWERGPYWLDGLVPLAYILEDGELISMARPWIEWAIENQRKDGYFGPLPKPEDAPEIPGTQQGNCEDWWPKMVMLKVLQQYYSATRDERVLGLMDRYFRYQLEMLPEFPLGHWTYWGNRRGGDNLAVVYWYYNIVKEPWLLELAGIIHAQTYDWTSTYSGNVIRRSNPYPRLHCVNVAQGLKEPVIYYQQHPEQKYLDAVKLGLESLRDVHGFVTGMYGGDEHLHGNNPTQGSELCSAIEMMFSFESMIPVTGDMYYADYLERIAFNVLPTQHDDRFLRRQYFQQANQVLVTNQERNFHNDHRGRIVYGVLTGYPCCTCNMHQGWPKFVQNLWYATADNGLAALVYGPSNVKARVSDGTEVRFIEQTDYPFSENVRFQFEAEKPVEFPFHLRVPAWCKNPEITLNGEGFSDTLKGEGFLLTLNANESISALQEKGLAVAVEDRLLKIRREWIPGDVIELVLPMEVEVSRWFEGSAGIQRGPLVYALRIEENWKEVFTGEWQHSYFEVTPGSPWNYGIHKETLENMEFGFREGGSVAEMPWNLENAPVSLTTSASRMPGWTLYMNSAGPLPSPAYPLRTHLEEREEITLIPYGCTTLRIAEFPVLD